MRKAPVITPAENIRILILSLLNDLSDIQSERTAHQGFASSQVLTTSQMELQFLRVSESDFVAKTNPDRLHDSSEGAP